MTARPQVELPDNRSTLLSGDLDVFASQYPKTADRIRAELNRLATRLAESEARAEGDARDAARYRALRELLCRVGARLVSFSGATPDSIDAAIDAAQEAEREPASPALNCWAATRQETT